MPEAKQKIVRDKDTTSERFRSMVSYLKFYALPFFSGGIFAMIILFAVLPSLQKTFRTLDEIDDLREQDTALQTRIERLETLQASASQIRVIVDRINTIVPTGQSDVVAFRERVVTSSTEESLDLDKLSSGETLLAADAQTVPNFNIIQIPSLFSLNGEFQSFRRFLNNLYSGDDFFIVNEMTLSFAPTEAEPDLWIGKFELIKYQFFADEEFDATATYTGVDDNAEPNAEVVNFLETRFVDAEP